MSFLLTLAFKNLSRHKKRTIFTTIGISVGIALLIWMDGMLRWADNESKRNLIRYEFGNFVLSKVNFKLDRDNFPLDKLMDFSAVKQIINKAEKEDLFCSPRTGFKVVLNNKRGFGLFYLVFAVDPVRYAKTLYVAKDIVKGKWLSEESMGIVISKNAAKDLDVKIGDTITIETKTKYGSFQSVSVTVEGIFDADDPSVNRNQAFVSYKFSDTFFQTESSASEIVFRSVNEKDEPFLSKMKDFINSIEVKDLVFSTWQELGADFIVLSKTKRAGTKIMIFFLFIITAIGIINTMLMAVFERIPELAMMRALGMKDNFIIFLFLLEATGIGFLGSTLGLFMGFFLNLWGVTKGLDFTGMVKDMDFGYRTGTVFYSEWNPDTMLLAFFFGIFCSVIVSILPAKKAVDITITDALHYQ